MRKKILMVCYGGGHVKIIEPLYQHLKYEYEITILALTMAAPYLKKMNVPYVTFKDFKFLFSEDVRSYGVEFTKHVSLNSEVDIEDSIYYMGCSYFDLVNDVGEQEANNRYLNKGRAAFTPTATLKKIIENLGPDIVVTTNSPRSERAALLSAKELNIRTLCINDNLGFNNGFLEVIEDNLADTICVLSKEVKKAMMGFNHEINVAVTGNPMFDKLKTLKRNNNNGKVTILFADNELPREHPSFPGIIGDPELADNIRIRLNEIAIVNNWQIIFRSHPNQNIDYSKYKNIMVSVNETLENQLIISDVILTNVSTVGVEGLAMGIPLVSIEGTIFNRDFSYYEMGLSVPVYSENDLDEAINIALASQDNTVELYSGLAVDNISNEIKKLIN